MGRKVQKPVSVSFFVQLFVFDSIFDFGFLFNVTIVRVQLANTLDVLDELDQKPRNINQSQSIPRIKQLRIAEFLMAVVAGDVSRQGTTNLYRGIQNR